MHLLRAQIAFASRRGSDAPLLLLRAARELEAVDPNLARATYLEALAAAMFAGRLARGGGAVEISEAALAGPPLPEPPRPSDLLLHGLAIRFTAGYPAGAPILKEALCAFQQKTVLPPQEARWLWFASWVALVLWDDEAWTVLSTRQLDLVRETGALTALPFVLTNRSSVRLLRRAESRSFARGGAASGDRSDGDRACPLRRAHARCSARSRGRAFRLDRNLGSGR